MAALLADGRVEYAEGITVLLADCRETACRRTPDALEIDLAFRISGVEVTGAIKDRDPLAFARFVDAVTAKGITVQVVR